MSPRHISKEEFATMQAKVRGGVDSDTQGRRGASRGSMPLTTGAFREPVAGANPAPSPSVQTFFVPGPLPGANDIIRKHWRVYSRLKVTWGQAIALVLLVYKIQPVRACTIRYQWIEPTPVRGHIRDRDNIRFGAKFINDALVSQGILLDDGPDGVVSLTDSFTYDGVKPGVQVTIEEVQP